MKRSNGTVKHFLSLVFALSTITFFTGCVVKDIGRTVEHTVKGDYYLKSEKTEEGRENFRQEVLENPDSALANYYYGRFLLKDKGDKEALKYLKKAKDLEPGNADYQFWAGVAYARNGNVKMEEQSYRAALDLDRNHLQALIYMGHNQLDRKHYPEALKFYSRALEIWPGSPAALYNRALILRRLGRTPEEKRGWHEYLSLYPSGAMARRAVDRLNALGDFAYRNHRLGTRTITIEKIRFELSSTLLLETSRDSLNLVGAILENLKKGTLQVVAYQKNNKELAHRRAIAIKRFLLREFPAIPADRIGVSWFAEPQTIIVNKKKLKIDESVSFFITASR